MTTSGVYSCRLIRLPKAVCGNRSRREQNRFKIPQRVAKSGKRVGGVGTIIHVSPWDKYGRRVFSMNVKGRGRVDIIQGITDITPRWTKAEGLQGDQPIAWDMRFATSSIPRDQLTAILEQHLDPKRAENRLRVVSFLHPGRTLFRSAPRINRSHSGIPPSGKSEE